MRALVFLCAVGTVSAEMLPAEAAAEINAAQKLWKAGPNPRLDAMSWADFKRSLGVKPSSLRRLKETAKPYVLKGLSIPASFDSGAAWPRCAKIIDDIRDQSNCGCCWAFGAAEAASSRLCIATSGKYQFPLSAQDLCFCSNPDGCDGGELYTAWDWIRSVGIVSGGQYNGTGPFGGGFCSAFSLPHCHHHGPQRNDPYPPEGSAGCPSQSSPWCPSSCDRTAVAPHNSWRGDKVWFDGSIQSPSDAAGVQEMIMTNGPVETAFTVYSDFANYTGGIYVQTSGEVLGGHAVMIVGWGEENGTPYWKVANSWNKYWGENGYFRIIRGQDECGIESSVTANEGSATWHTRDGAGNAVQLS